MAQLNAFRYYRDIFGKGTGRLFLGCGSLLTLMSIAELFLGTESVEGAVGSSLPWLWRAATVMFLLFLLHASYKKWQVASAASVDANEELQSARTNISKLEDALRDARFQKGEIVTRRLKEEARAKAVEQAQEDASELAYHLGICVRRWPAGHDPAAMARWEWESKNAIGQHVYSATELLIAAGEWARATLLPSAREKLLDSNNDSTLISYRGVEVMRLDNVRHKTSAGSIEVGPKMAFRLGQLETGLKRILADWGPQLVKINPKKLSTFLPPLQPWQPPEETGAE